uniref:Transposase n=1 Tax=Ascaris lumbricoides TaxID=6252 RepID=A0A0M3IGD7_ASCLU
MVLPAVHIPWLLKYNLMGFLRIAFRFVTLCLLNKKIRSYTI